MIIPDKKHRVIIISACYRKNIFKNFKNGKKDGHNIIDFAFRIIGEEDKEYGKTLHCWICYEHKLDVFVKIGKEELNSLCVAINIDVSEKKFNKSLLKMFVGKELIVSTRYNSMSGFYEGMKEIDFNRNCYIKKYI